MIEPSDIVNVRLDKLEAEVKTIRAQLSATERTQPMDLGNTFYAPGDPVPSKSATDLLDGLIFSIKVGPHKFPFVFKKNTSGAILRAGDKFETGIVDKTLRSPCEPNNFFYLEI